MHYCYIDCGLNDQTDLFKVSSLLSPDSHNNSCINIGGYDQNHILNIYLNSDNDQSLIKKINFFSWTI